MARPLDGIKVVDLTSNVAGPFATMVLGDLGADVIKIEEPKRGDDIRQTMPRWGGEAVTFLMLNRNKRSVAVNLKHPKGREIMLQLVKEADVVIESFRTGTAESLGVAYEDLRKLREGLIYCSISGFGRTGRGSHLPAYDPVVQAYTGIMSIIGEEGRPPVRGHPAPIDLSTGLWAVIAILAALRTRDRSGQGQHIDVPLVATGINLMALFIGNYLATGQVPKRQGSAMPAFAPYEAFETAAGYLMVAAGNDANWKLLCGAIGRLDLLSDPRFSNNSVRVTNRDALHQALVEVFRGRPVEQWVEILSEAGVPCSAVHNVEQLLERSEVRDLNMIVPTIHPTVHDLRLVALPIKSAALDFSFKPPPVLGQHTEEVLRELGYTAERVAALRNEGLVK